MHDALESHTRLDLQQNFPQKATICTFLQPPINFHASKARATLHGGGKPIALKRLNISRVTEAALFPSSDFPIIVTTKIVFDNAALQICFGIWALIKGAGQVFISAFSIDFQTYYAAANPSYTMAPHALPDLLDVSGYYPSPVHQALSPTSTNHKSLKPSLPGPVPHAKTLLGVRGFGNESPRNVWTLSSDEISEVEKNVRSFLSMSKTFSVAYIV